MSCMDFKPLIASSGFLLVISSQGIAAACSAVISVVAARRCMNLHFHVNCRILIISLLLLYFAHSLCVATLQAIQVVRYMVYANPCVAAISSALCFGLRFPAAVCVTSIAVLQVGLVVERAIALSKRHHYETLSSTMGFAITGCCKVLMCWYSIPLRTTSLNRSNFSADIGGTIFSHSPNCHFFETLDWLENEQVADHQSPLICYDTGNDCGSSSFSLLHKSDAEKLLKKLANSYPQAIALDEFSLLFSNSSGVTNASKPADVSTCTKECTLEHTTIKTTERVKPNRSQETSEKSHSRNQEKRKEVNEAFEELLSLQGFNVPRKSYLTLNEIRRAEEVENLSPVSIKIRNWITGKEGNIRALLASLNDVLWEGAGQWPHHRMADFYDNQVKRCYHRACLVVHPDKHVGQEHEELARAIFTELNEAWNIFVQNSRFSKSSPTSS